MGIRHLACVGGAAGTDVQCGHGWGILEGGEADLDIGHDVKKNGKNKALEPVGIPCKTRHCRRIGYLQCMRMFPICQNWRASRPAAQSHTPPRIGHQDSAWLRVRPPLVPLDAETHARFSATIEAFAIDRAHE